MCNITYLKPGIEVPEDGIANATTWNDDGHGWGIAVDHGQMLTGHYMQADEALDTFIAARRNYPDTHAVFHSRLATHGTVTLENVHPFPVGRFAVVAHNGILPGKFQPNPEFHGERSDTAVLADFWLAGRSQISGVWTRRERKRIARIIGTGNKLCILSVSPYLPEPRAYLINGEQGYWDDKTGAWFSSTSYKSQWTPRKSGWSGGWDWDWNDADYEWQKDEHTGVWRRVRNDAEAKTTVYCPLCNHYEGVDEVSNVCLYCDSCLDCFSALRNCQCGYPGDTKVTDFGDGVQMAISELRTDSEDDGNVD
jgi:glutamine amidotransferase